MPHSLSRIALLLSVLFLFPSLGGSQELADTTTASRTEPEDSYQDAEVEALLTLARQAQSEIEIGLQGYEARMWESVRIGITGDEFRRERGVFEQERGARIRWSRDEDHLLLWEHARRELPITGISSANNEGLSTALERDLMEGGDNLPAPLLYDPGSDRISFGRERFLSPLSDTAAFHYRYHSDGRILRLGFDESGEALVLREIRVEPRRADPRLISASLWFDIASGALVRSTYRPARPFDLVVDRDEGEGGGNSGFLSGILVAKVNYVTVDHGFYNQRWWIPRRFAFEGEVQLGGFAHLPVTVEWTLDDVYINDEGDLLPYLTTLAENLPEGWRNERLTQQTGRGEKSVSIFLPPTGDITPSPGPSGEDPSARAGASVFSPDEIAALERAIEEVEGASNLSNAYLEWQARDGLVYFNRVEGLSLGLSSSLPVASRTEIGAGIRYGLSDEEWGGEFGVLHRLSSEQTLSATLFRRLDPSSEWVGSKGVVSSLSTLLLGKEHTPFHRAEGVELAFHDRSGPLRHEVQLFFERHTSAIRNTNTHLARLWSEDLLPLNPPSNEGRWAGLSVDTKWEAGDDPRDLHTFGRFHGEGAGGSTQYLRGWLSAGAVLPLGEHWGGALEGGFGASAGDLPLQRHFAPGGPTIFRGISSGELSGEAFWFGRLEVGRGLPIARVVLFMDVLELSPHSTLGAFREVEPELVGGVGISLLDGLLRVDLARQLSREGEKGWKLFLYRDGLF